MVGLCNNISAKLWDVFSQLFSSNTSIGRNYVFLQTVLYLFNPFQTVEKPIFSFLMLTYETKVPFTVHILQKSIMCYISMESL